MKTLAIATASMASVLLIAVAIVMFSKPAHAHCDQMDGPVVTEAQTALESGDIDPVLKWIAPADEAAIRDTFARTRAVREMGGEARILADRYFFETLVRIHRAWEGEPFTGLKPADTPVHPAIEAADETLESGSDEALLEQLRAEVTHGVHERFENVQVKKAAASDSAEAGRAYVKAYVEYVHYVLGVHKALAGAGHGPVDE